MFILVSKEMSLFKHLSHMAEQKLNFTLFQCYELYDFTRKGNLQVFATRASSQFKAAAARPFGKSLKWKEVSKSHCPGPGESPRGA